MIRMTVPSMLLLVVVTACGSDTAPAAGEGLRVMVTTSVLADVVADLVGEHGSVETLMEAGADPHDFTPSAEQASRLRSADLVVANGLGLEAGLADMLEAAAADGAEVVRLAEHVDPLPFGGEAPGESAMHPDHDRHQEEEGHTDDTGEPPKHGELDPHFALDPLRMADAMDVVADALSGLDGSVDWEGRAARVRADLESLHRQIDEELSVVPAERRKLVTNHHALGYFADRYGFEVVGTVIPGGSTLAEPSASDLAELADLLTGEDVTALFAETTVSAELAETVAAEVGEDVEVHHLYTDSLGPEGSGAESYAGMMRANASTIAAALGS